MKTRKLFAALLAFALCMSLFAGCGDAKEETKVTPQEETAAASAAPAAEAKSEAAPAAAESKSESAPAAEEAKEEAPAEDVTAESLLQGYYDQAGDIKSMSFNMIMDVQMKMAAMGQEEEMQMNMDVTTETYENNSHMTGKMVSSVYGEEESEEVETYIMLEDGEYVSYSYHPDSETWSRSESDTPAITKDLIPKVDASKFELAEEGGRYKVSGAVEIRELFESMGAAFGDAFSGFAGMDMENITGAAKVEYFFNKDTKDLEEVNIDMAEAFEAMMKSMFAALFEGQDLGEEVGSLEDVFSITIGSFRINLSKMLINQGKEIVLPEAAVGAQEFETGDISDITDDSGAEKELSVELAESFDFQDSYFKFSFMGKDYEVNKTRVSDVLADCGLEVEESDREKMVESNDLDYATIYLNDDFDSVTFYVRNDQDEEALATDCVIYGVDFSTYGSEKIDCEVAGFKLGVTLDELIEKLGNPTYGYEMDSYRSYSWEGEEYDSLSFTFSGGFEGVTGMNVTGYNW